MYSLERVHKTQHKIQQNRSASSVIQQNLNSMCSRSQSWQVCERSKTKFSISPQKKNLVLEFWSNTTACCASFRHMSDGCWTLPGKKHSKAALRVSFTSNQITVGKDSNDPSSSRHPQLHTLDTEFAPEVSPVMVNPARQVSLFRLSREIHWNLKPCSRDHKCVPQLSCERQPRSTQSRHHHEEGEGASLP